MSEPEVQYKHIGWIEVICGGMFSGKTEELIRRAKRAHIAGQTVVIIKPSFDKRYKENKVISHNSNELPSLIAETSDEILPITGNAKVVCIDEAQFFDNHLVDVANSLADKGKRVIIAGLDMDYLGKPFEPIPQLMAIAEYVTKLHAVCSESGMMAHFSQRIVKNKDRYLLGEQDSYEPRARQCFRPPVDIKRGKPVPPLHSESKKEEN